MSTLKYLDDYLMIVCNKFKVGFDHIASEK